jgi:hypothetical protein
MGSGLHEHLDIVILWQKAGSKTGRLAARDAVIALLAMRDARRAHAFQL